MMQLPEAIPDDGLLDVTIFSKMSKMKVIANVKGLYDGSFKTLKEVSVYRGKEISIDSEHPIMLECDGELLGHSPATIQYHSFRFQVCLLKVKGPFPCF